MKAKKVILVLACFLTAASICSQTFDVVPYEYGFEPSEAVEQAKWVLNPGATAENVDHWTIGSSIAHAGKQSMYITFDSVNCGAGSSQNQQVVQFAYRDFVLPDGNYYFTFDWICPSMQLYAGYISYVNLNPQHPANSIKERAGFDVLPDDVFPSVGALTSDVWRNAYIPFTVTQPTNGQVRTTRIWFAWVNSQENTEQTGISAAIDNLQLTDQNCEIPYNLEGEVLDCDNVNFTWMGSSMRYQFQYRPTGDTGKWRNRTVNNGYTHITLQSMSEGNYDIRLRGVCQTEYTDSVTGAKDTVLSYSPFIYMSNFNIFCPELHCINYMNITDTNWAVCTYGSTQGNSNGYPTAVDAPYQSVGCVDFGWENIKSRHTIVWDTTAMDPRTNDQLRMVPSGATASVRLGNWESGYGAEAITYKYNVDADNSILLVNYAIVLEDPDGHGADNVPRFIIKIKDEKGGLIDKTCGQVDLNSEMAHEVIGGTPWTSVQYNEPGSYYPVNIVYKDWTTLGLNLDPYVGQTIYISVETFDCFWSAHFGYAYFTMDCQTARIKNTSCGKQDNMIVSAPTGFYYQWFADKETTPRYTTQSVEILATDPTNWRCVLTSTENDGCSFDLEVNTTARYPQPEFSYEYVPSNCENIYLFKNSSYVWTNEDGERHEHREEVCDEYEWFFGKADEEDDTTDPNPGYVTFPENGGTYYVTLRAILGQGGGMCEKDTTIKIEVPALGDTHTIIDTLICEGSYIEFHERKYFEEGTYFYVGQTPAGCYANDTLHLTVAPQSLTTLDTVTICYGDTAWVADEYRTREGVIKHKFISELGCDSIVVLPVHMLPHMRPEVDVQNIDETHDYGSITVTIHPEDSILYYTINGDRYETSTELTGLEGGTFSMVFYNRLGCTVEEVVDMCVYEIFQRWNDVVSLKNKNERGGGEFIAYQWFMNGELIEGANRSYYYKHDGFDGTEVFFCLVTLPDGSQEESCTFTPTYYPIEEDVTVYPSNVQGNATVNVVVPEAAEVTVYTTMGVTMQTLHVEKGTTSMRAPANKGVYLVSIRMAERILTERIVVE